MQPQRRQFLRLAGLAALVPVGTRLARAESYPTRPVRLVVPYAASGGNDIVGRLIAQWLTERLGQNFLVDNRPGGGGNVGTEAVVLSPPDGYTLLLASAANAINATLYSKLSFNFMRDTRGIAGIIRVPSVILLHPSVPAKDLAEFIAYAKRNPGKLSFASGGTGTSTHLAGELFKMMAGVDMLHVPYRGTGPAMTDLLGGQVQVMLASAPSSVDFIKNGRVHALAVTAPRRLEALPDVPTVAETIPGFEASQWYGLAAPKATPDEIAERLNREVNAALADPKLKTRFTDLGGTELPGSAAAFDKFIADETEKWAKVVTFSNAKVN